jgi:uncharacterized protein
MPPELSTLEVRVIACLIEKQVTTPEQYPLSLNAVHNACNQKSNRDPVLALTESEVQGALDSLARRHLVLERSGFGSRVPKYQQRLCNTEFSSLQLSAQERAVLCELMLRGPQTAGELRARAARMASFADAAEVESALEALVQHSAGPLVRRLAREPGRRELRYAQLLGPAAAAEAPAPLQSPQIEATLADPTEGTRAAAASVPLEERVRLLEREVARLSAALVALGALSGGTG